MKKFLFIFLFFVPSFTFAESAASLSLLPEVGTYRIGDEFTVTVNADTGGRAINAAEGELSFNTEELEAVGLSKEGSLLESWTVEPEYSNEKGSIRFGGGVKSFTGDSGKIFSIIFRALKNTEAQVRFSTGAAILANNGLGTNILSVMSAGTYRLVPKEIIPEAEQSEFPEPLVLGASASSEEKILVTSPTHPDENRWYGERNARFLWTLPSGANAVRLSVTASSGSAPINLYPPIHEKIIPDMDEGVSYFHIQAHTDFGWSEPALYRVQIDTRKPESFAIAEAKRDGVREFLFDARDSGSGIEKYLIQTDHGAETEWRDDGSHRYILPAHTAGAHTLSAKAFDFSGNFATSSVYFTLDPVSSPVITDFDPELAPNSMLVVRGTAVPNADITVRVRKDGARPKEYKTKSAENGKFIFVMDEKTEEGVYEISAEAVAGGVLSDASGSVLVSVRESAMLFFGTVALTYLSVIIPLVTLVLLLLFIIAYGFHQFKIFRLNLEKEVEKAETVSRESFESVRREIYEDERILASIGDRESDGARKVKEEKRKTTVSRLEKTVDAAEEKVEKEIADVKEKVKKPAKLKAKRV